MKETMENTVSKKEKTVGPFPLPIGEKAGKKEINFIEYNEYTHSGEKECCKWGVDDYKHVSCDGRSDANLAGPFTRNYSVFYTCQNQKC